MEVAKEKSEMLLRKHGHMKYCKNLEKIRKLQLNKQEKQETDNHQEKIGNTYCTRKKENNRNKIEAQNHGCLSTHCFPIFFGGGQSYVFPLLFYYFENYQDVPVIQTESYVTYYICMYIYIYILIQYTKNFVQHVQICPETCNNGPPGGTHGMPLSIGTFLPDPNDQYALVLVPGTRARL